MKGNPNQGTKSKLININKSVTNFLNYTEIITEYFQKPMKIVIQLAADHQKCIETFVF